jgi:alpha-amylase
MLVATLLFAIALVSAFVPQHSWRAEPCSNYQGMDSCQGNQVNYPESVEQRRWQTPPISSPSYVSKSWQSYRNLQGYARVLYSAVGTTAKVKVITTVRVKTKILYQFGDGSSWVDHDVFEVDENSAEGIVITIWTPDLDNSTLVLDPLYFTWQSPEVIAPHTKQGQRGAIVELFGWPYQDVAQECSTFLGKAGYMGVKIFPAQEHIETYEYLQNGELNPWYFTYQPVSYKLSSRLGSRQDLRSMILTCRKNGTK